MTFTPSNRPVPSDAPEDLYYNSGLLDQYVNSDEETMVDRTGTTRYTIKGLQTLSGDAAASAEAAAESALTAQQAAEAAETAADLAVTNADIYATTAAGLAATTNGQYFSVPSANSSFYLDLYRNNAGSAVLERSYPGSNIDSVVINSGKAFPLKAMTRGGVLSAASTTFNRLILSVRIMGDQQYLNGKYFQIGYFQNEANISGNADMGIVINEFDAATYAATGTAVVIHNHTDTPPDIVRTGGVQTFSIVPAQRPKLRFIVTIDAAALPAAGTPVNALPSANAAYSWIIEPSAYLAIPGMGDTISINKYRVYPQKVSARNGTTSAEPSAFMATLLDLQVTGARPGKLYRVAYFKNGSTALPGPADGWIFEEFDALNYETAANPALTVVNYTDPVPTLVRSGVQTLVIDSPVVTGLKFRVTLDTSSLPPVGTFIASNLSSQAGYSYIIDPQRYTLAPSAASVSTLPVMYSLDNSGNLVLSWASKDSCYRIKVGLLGVNQMPNILETSWAPGADLNGAVWTVLNTTGSDYLPPMQVAAQSGGDSGTLAFTGGAHGSNGDSTGSPTARSTLYQAYADGQPILPGTSGRAASVNLHLVEELMGYNTKTTGRYIVRRAYSVQITPEGFVATAVVTALEPITVVTDYGLQGITFGYQGTQLVLGGQNTARIPFVSGAQTQSGSKTAYPNAWAAVFQESTHGQMALWLDKSYADGDGKYVDPAGVLVRGEATTKWYLGVVLPAISGTPVGHNFATGESYRYRAGLSWQSNGMQPTGMDSLVQMPLDGTKSFAYGLPDASFVRIK